MGLPGSRSTSAAGWSITFIPFTFPWLHPFPPTSDPAGNQADALWVKCLCAQRSHPVHGAVTAGADVYVVSLLLAVYGTDPLKPPGLVSVSHEVMPARSHEDRMGA